MTYEHMRPLSCLVCNRKLALEHYLKRIKKAEDLGLNPIRSREPRMARIWGFEPGTKPVSHGGFSDEVADDFESQGSNIDIRHNKTFTSIKLDSKDFKVLPTGFREINYWEMKDWDLKALFGKGIKNHTTLDFD